MSGKRMFVMVLWTAAFLATPVCEAREPAQTAQPAAGTVDLHQCHDGNLRVSFLCDPDWELQTEDGTILMIVEQQPLVTLTVARSDAPVIFPQQLTSQALKEIGQYADGFSVKRGVSLAGAEAVMVEGVSARSPETWLLDHYLIHDFQLYSFLFSVEPKERWPDYAPLIRRILTSIEFTSAAEKGDRQ